MQRDVTRLKDRPDRDRELLPALGALPNAFANVGFAYARGLEPVGVSEQAAVGANGAIGPALPFQEVAGLVFVGKILG